ncbi:MAG: cell division protein FtsH, partial [Pseudomonadota bacterium]
YLGETLVNTAPRDYSEATAREVDTAVRSLIDEAYKKAIATLNKRQRDLKKGAHLLLEKETVTPEEFPALKPKTSAGKTSASHQAT